MVPKIQLAVSACLLGEPVRYDGTDNLDPYLVRTLAKWVKFHPVCPEAEAGMTTPREPVNLVADGPRVRALGRETGGDYTHGWTDSAHRYMKENSDKEFWGMVLKARSPSCGVVSPVHTGCGAGRRNGTGIFAAAAMEAFPHIPIVSEEALYNPRSRDNFITRLFALKRLRDFMAKPKSKAALVAFHTNEKLLLMAHSHELGRKLGVIVADPASIPTDKRYEEYAAHFAKALTYRSTRVKNCKVLNHVAGYFKKELGEPERVELGEALEDYKKGILPLVVPATLVRSWAGRKRHPWLLTQSYFDRDPLELKLRVMG